PGFRAVRAPSSPTDRLYREHRRRRNGCTSNRSLERTPPSLLNQVSGALIRHVPAGGQATPEACHRGSPGRQHRGCRESGDHSWTRRLHAFRSRTHRSMTAMMSGICTALTRTPSTRKLGMLGLRFFASAGSVVVMVSCIFITVETMTELGLR